MFNNSSGQIWRFGYHSTIVVILVLLTINLFNLNIFTPSLGTDPLVLLWPVGQQLANSNEFSNFLKILFSGSMGEDHIFAIKNIFAYLIYSDERDLLLTVRIYSITVFLFTLLGMCISCYVLWRDWTRLTILLTLLAANISLFSENVIGPSAAGGILIATWSFCFLCIFLKHQKPMFLYMSTLTLMLAILATETSFILIPLFLILVASLYTHNGDTSKYWGMAKSGLTIVMATLPYFLIHYKIFGTIMPASRIGVIRQASYDGIGTEFILRILNSVEMSELMELRIVYFLKMLVMLLSSWFFGIFRTAFEYGLIQFFGLMALVTSFMIVVIKYRSYSYTGAILLVALGAMTSLIFYTTRYGAGLWMFAGLIANMCLADVLATLYSSISKRIHPGLEKKHGYLASLFLIPMLLSINSYAKPHDRLEQHFVRKSNQDYAGYRAIGGPNNKLVIIRLPDGDHTLYHPIQFWMGNKMYHGEPALVYFEKSNEMLFRDMFVETHYNPSNQEFDYFREAATSLSSQGPAVLLRDSNTYTRIYGHGSGGKLFRSGMFRGIGTQPIRIYLPDLSQRFHNYSDLTVRLLFDRKAPKVKSISYGGRETSFTTFGSEIIFQSNDYRQSNILRVDIGPSDVRLLEIEGWFKTFSEKEKLSTELMSGFQLRSDTEPWRYWIVPDTNNTVPGWNVVGTLSTGINQNIKLLAQSLGDNDPFQINYISFDQNREKRETGSRKIETNTMRDILITR
jgi:hypothetical protein